MDREQDRISPLSEKTKRTIAILFLLACIVLQFVIYGIAFENGHSKGWEEGRQVPPKYIVEQSDEKAMATLAAFMAESASGPDSLARLLNDKEQGLAWIRDASLRNDVCWGLARELLIERGDKQAVDEIRQLVSQGYGEGEPGKWAARALFTAELLLSRDQVGDATVLFRQASMGYELAGDNSGLIESLNGYSSSLLAANAFDEALKVLGRLEQLSAADAAARSRILATMGGIARIQGKTEDARKHFSTALALWQQDSAKADEQGVGSARICMAEAFLESGNFEQAERMFLSGINGLKGSEAELSFLLSALRGLARIASEKENYQDALAYLYQAEGAAKGRLADKDFFWSCLYDQRGWVLLHKSEPEAAVKDFARVVNLGGASDAMVQSSEGLGLAYIELGREEAAYKHLKKAAELREQLFANDKESLGRVYKSLGMACDLLGKNDEALQFYNKAEAAQEQCGKTAGNRLYIDTLLCRSHTLCELKQWQQGVDSFNKVIPLLQGEERSETYKHLAACYDNLGMTDKGDECWKNAGYPRVSAPKPAAGRRR